MEAAQQPRRRARLIRTERTIIERPRLIKRLDESRARMILLLAPAGFGKTTLAKQWRRTLTNSVLLALTSAHRDVTVIARDLARSIEAAGVDGYVAFMEQYIQARRSPQSEAASLGRALAEGLERAKAQWIVVDDYHDVATTPEAEELIETIVAGTSGRFLIASRVKPAWARARHALYGELDVLDRAALAMDVEEAQALLGRTGRLARQLIAMADGWPAVLALAAPLDFDLPNEIRSDALHEFLAEEFVEALSSAGQKRLMEVALLPERLNPFQGLPREDAKLLRVILDDGRNLHRLLRDFLLQKIQERPDGLMLATEAAKTAVTENRWERAFELIERFTIDALIEDTAEQALAEYTKTGQIWTLGQFSTAVKKRVPKSGVLALVDGEVAWAQGQLEVLAPIARRAARLLGREHRFYSHARFLEARSLFYSGETESAYQAYLSARESAQSERDAGEALFGLASASLHSEISETAMGDVRKFIQELEQRQDASIEDLHRYLSIAHSRSIYRGQVTWSPFIQQAMATIDASEDAWRISSLLFIAAYTLMLRAEYERAAHYSGRMRESRG